MAKFVLTANLNLEGVNFSPAAKTKIKNLFTGIDITAKSTAITGLKKSVEDKLNDGNGLLISKITVKASAITSIISQIQKGLNNNKFSVDIIAKSSKTAARQASSRVATAAAVDTAIQPKPLKFPRGDRFGRGGQFKSTSTTQFGPNAPLGPLALPKPVEIQKALVALQKSVAGNIERGRKAIDAADVKSQARQSRSDARRRFLGIQRRERAGVNRRDIEGGFDIGGVRGLPKDTATLATRSEAGFPATPAGQVRKSDRFVPKEEGPSFNAKRIRTAKTEVDALNKSLKTGKKAITEFGEQAGQTFRRFLAYNVVTSIFLSVTRQVSEAARAFLDFDRELVRLQQVTNATDISIGKIRKQVRGLSSEFGTNSQELLESSRILAQAGFTVDEVTISLETLAKTQLAPTFDNAAQSAEGLIAIMRQFNIEANETEAAMGSVNAVAAQFAVESRDILDAVRRAGGAFNAVSQDIKAPLQSFQEFIALFTSVRQTTRESAQSIATGLRTIFTRLQRTKTSNALDDVGVSLTELDKKGREVFVGPFEAISRLNIAFERLDKTASTAQIFGLVEQLGGFRQVSRLIPLIEQFGVATDVLGVSMLGVNSLTEDMVQAQASLEVQFTRIGESWKSVTAAFADSSGIKTVVGHVADLSNILLGLQPIVSKLAPAITLIAGAKIGKTLLGVGAPFARGFLDSEVGPGGGRGGGSRLSELSGKEKRLEIAAVQQIRIKRDLTLAEFKLKHSVTKNDVATDALTKEINTLKARSFKLGLSQTKLTKAVNEESLAAKTRRRIGDKLAGRGGQIANGALLAGGIIGAGISSFAPTTTAGGSNRGAFGFRGLGGAATGAATGALLGSVIPGIGTALGAVTGGLFGLVRSLKSVSEEILGAKIEDNFQLLRKSLENLDKAFEETGPERDEKIRQARLSSRESVDAQISLGRQKFFNENLNQGGAFGTGVGLGLFGGGDFRTVTVGTQTFRGGLKNDARDRLNRGFEDSIANNPPLANAIRTGFAKTTKGFTAEEFDTFFAGQEGKQRRSEIIDSLIPAGLEPGSFKQGEARANASLELRAYVRVMSGLTKHQADLSALIKDTAFQMSSLVSVIPELSARFVNAGKILANLGRSAPTLDLSSGLDVARFGNATSANRTTQIGNAINAPALAQAATDVGLGRSVIIDFIKENVGENFKSIEKQLSDATKGSTVGQGTDVTAATELGANLRERLKQVVETGSFIPVIEDAIGALGQNVRDKFQRAVETGTEGQLADELLAPFRSITKTIADAAQVINKGILKISSEFEKIASESAGTLSGLRGKSIGVGNVSALALEGLRRTSAGEQAGTGRVTALRREIEGAVFNRSQGALLRIEGGVEATSAAEVGSTVREKEAARDRKEKERLGVQQDLANARQLKDSDGKAISPEQQELAIQSAIQSLASINIEWANLDQGAKNAKQALSNLAETQHEIAITTERLNSLEKERQGLLSFAARLFTGDRKARREADLGVRVTNIAATGGIAGLRNAGLLGGGARALAGRRAFQAVATGPLANVEGADGRTGKEIFESVLTALSKQGGLGALLQGGLTANAGKTGTEQDKLKEQFETQRAAIAEQIKLAQEAATRAIKDAATVSGKFFEEISLDYKESVIALQEAAKNTAIAATELESGGAKIAKAADTLKEINLPSQIDVTLKPVTITIANLDGALANMGETMVAQFGEAFVEQIKGDPALADKVRGVLQG